jgi:putative endonuclease
MRGAQKLMLYFVYILQCADNSLYIGCTNNLEKRIKQHNDSKWGAHYTKIRRPVILKYSEQFKTLKEARRRESQIKSWRRDKKINLINSGGQRHGCRAHPK